MSLFQDLRFALRIMRKNPGFTAVTAMALALGIGANNTAFTLVNTILLKNLPFKDGHEIVSLGCSRPSKGTVNMAVSYPDFQDWRARSRSFQGIGAFVIGTMNVSDEGGVPERLSGAWLSANSFALIGQSPVMGRDFLPEEDQRQAQPVALLGYGMWQARYGGNPAILGKTIRLNAVPATVIGIMPQGMKFPFDAELWMPLIQTRDREERSYRDLLVFGRLCKRMTVAQAQSELKGIAAQLSQEHPKSNAGISAEVMSFNERFNAGEMKLVLWIMMGAVGFVLLIACVNVANLLLARAACRSTEISIRSAVGAGRWRIIRQLLIESILLAFLGGLFGMLLSIAGVRWFKLSLSMANIEGMPYWLDFSMDWKVFLYFCTVCLATSILFGLVPALKATRMNLVETLKESGHAGGEGSKSARVATSLVVAQLTLTLILLAGAGMMMLDFLHSRRISLGMNPENVLTMRLGLPEQKYPTPEDRIAFHERLSLRLQATPGVGSVAITSHLPVDGAWTGKLQLEGEVVEDKDKLPIVPAVSVSPDYFKTLGANILRGRTFDARDGKAGWEAVIVNERFAARYWQGQDPLGKRFRLLGEEAAPWLRVIGVAPQINREIQRDADSEAIVYVPFRQTPTRFASVVVRSLVQPASLVHAVRSEVQAVDPDLPLYRVRTMAEHLEQQLWPYRVFGVLFVAFGAASLLLSAVGIYGVTSYSVSRRTWEFGMRMALGADGGNVLWLVLRQCIRQLAAGLTLGLLGALAMGHVLEKLLVDARATDPLVNLAVSLTLCVVTTLASVAPAWKASRLDPLSALRIRR